MYKYIFLITNIQSDTNFGYCCSEVGGLKKSKLFIKVEISYYIQFFSWGIKVPKDKKHGQPIIKHNLICEISKCFNGNNELKIYIYM